MATGALGLLMLAGCATSPTGRSQLMLMPESEMTEMGQQAFMSIKKDTPVDKNATVNSYVQCVGQAITREVGRGRWEIVVFEDKDANAFALPGNKIGVNSGLLKVAKNQDQLATVVGHEVAHVLSHHANERVSQRFAVQEGLALISALANPRSGTGQSMMGLLGAGAQYGILMPYSRVQESEADRLGLDLMAKAGFNPRESLNLWKNMTQAGGAQPPEFLSTHPSYSTRITDLNAHLPVALRLQQRALQLGRHPSCQPSPG
jgi:predicted Zn-dependent protease